MGGGQPAAPGRCEGLVVSMIAPCMAFLGITMMAVITVSGTFFGASYEVLDARISLTERATELNGTSLSFVDPNYAAPYVTITLRNDGRVPLRDFADWDLWVSYQEADDTFHSLRLDYTATNLPSVGEWTVATMYVDSTTLTPEAYQPRILDPAEDLVIVARISPDAGVTKPNFATISTANGVSLTLAFSNESLAATPGDARRR